MGVGGGGEVLVKQYGWSYERYTEHYSTMQIIEILHAVPIQLHIKKETIGRTYIGRTPAATLLLTVLLCDTKVTYIKLIL